MNKVAMMINARKLFKNISDLPAIPVVASKVISMLNDVDAEPAEIADVILSDQVLAARVIRIVNSPLFRSNSEITSVKRALLHLGFKSVREMIMTSCFIESFNKKENRSAKDIQKLWMHSFSVGVMSRRIASQIGYQDADKAYLVGIVHDIGKVCLDFYCNKEYVVMLADIGHDESGIYKAEHSLFGTTHCEIGLCLAQSWNFPLSYCEVISHHHNLETETADPLLLAIVSLADFLCLAHQNMTEPKLSILPGSSEERAWKTIKEHSQRGIPDDLGVYISDLTKIFDVLHQEVDQLFNTMTA